jgi:hypothetical protein
MKFRLHNTPALFDAVDLPSYFSGFVGGEGCVASRLCPADAVGLGARYAPAFPSRSMPIELNCSIGFWSGGRADPFNRIALIRP